MKAEDGKAVRRVRPAERSVRHIAIIGGGLIGSMLAIYLARRGNKVSVFERRQDPRASRAAEGRSINLALSTRGIRALEEIGLAEAIKQMTIPMHGRIMHDKTGNLTFLRYGRQGQYINAVSRNDLNSLLVNKAEENGVHFFFEHRCTQVNPDKTSISISSGQNKSKMHSFDVVAGADGAFSVVRFAMQVTDRFNYSQHYLDHGYKELHIPPAKGGDFRLEKNALHIWPRGSYMLIALPNTDGSFTCTLFIPFEGPVSFSSLTNDHLLRAFFKEIFPDVVNHMPQLAADYNSNPTGSLVTIKCFPWVRNNTFLIGDAAHAIVPFYGQGMNAGFEDCRILNQLLDVHKDQWPEALAAFQAERKEDGDAIAQLAFDNFIEMRDLVANPEFLLKKKIEAKLHDLYPQRWIPLYSMVTFDEQIRYADAYRVGKKQERIMDEVMRMPHIETAWQDLDFGEIVSRLD